MLRSRTNILNPSELEEVIELFQKKGTKKQAFEEYERYVKILNELKEMGYFTLQEYSNRIDKLNKYFKVAF